MDPILRALREASRSRLLPPESRILLAVSGGADSMALLYGASELAGQESWALVVGHVHHGWRKREADRDLAFVAGHARRLGLPFVSRLRDARGASRRLGLSPEAAARHVRYAALTEMAREARCSRIATAHQREDRLESFLLAVERKGGLARLAGPRPERRDGVVRPLLRVSRDEILDFLEQRGIPFRRDSTNGDLRLNRNRIRRRISAMRQEPGGESALRQLEAAIDRMAAERERLDRQFEERVRPVLQRLPGAVRADAGLLCAFPQEVQRRALEEIAIPFALPGRPPMTGREREEILRRLATGRDFRFEAGRRIRFVRRGRWLETSPRSLEAL
jgi:tRNA(Ile)-lysidine synthase